MIIEFLQQLFTSASPLARQRGLLKEAIAMDARYKRCKSAWGPHLNASKQAVLEAAERCEKHRTAVILGAGALRDVPLDELCSKFNKVRLVDMVFTRSTRQEAKRHGAECVEADLVNETPFLPYDLEIDLMVSLNMLSQLPLSFPKEQAKRIIEGHLEYLRQFECTTLLITDRNWVYTDHEDNEIERQDALAGVQLPEPDHAWEWDIAPIPEVSRKITIKHEVQAIYL